MKGWKPIPPHVHPSRRRMSHSTVKRNTNSPASSGEFQTGIGGQRLDADLPAERQFVQQPVRRLDVVEAALGRLGGQTQIVRVHRQSCEFTGRRHDDEIIGGRIVLDGRRGNPRPVGSFGQIADRTLEDPPPRQITMQLDALASAAFLFHDHDHPIVGYGRHAFVEETHVQRHGLAAKVLRTIRYQLHGTTGAQQLRAAQIADRLDPVSLVIHVTAAIA